MISSVDQLLKTSEDTNLTFTEPEGPVEKYSGFFKRHHSIVFVMRVSVFYLVLLTCSMQMLLANPGWGQPISEIEVTVGMHRGENLESLFKNIEKQSGLLFAFDYVKVNKYTNIRLEKATRTVKETLDIVLRGTPLIYRQVKNNVIIFQEGEEQGWNGEAFFINKVREIEMPLRVTGKVTDIEGVPMAGVNVIVKGTTRGTSTNADGNFSIDAEGNEVLVFSFIGFKTFETQVNTRVVIDVTLEEDAEALQEVVVNAGYYNVKDREKTGSISKVSSEIIQNQPVSNPMQALQGRVPGVYITQTSGIPGGTLDVRIRGTNSLTSGNDPLYVIDGVPYISESLSRNEVANIYPSNGQRSLGTSPLNSINPNDIESIEILKDADATAIYGSRGANGVVLITTKRGESEKLNVEINYRRGVSRLTQRADLLNTKEYIAMRLAAVANDGDEMPNANEYDINGTWDQERYTDWQDVLIGGTAEMNDLNVSVSAGSKETKFLFGAGYNDQSTVFPADDLVKRFSTHFSISHNSADDKFQSRIATNYSINNSNIKGRDYTSQALKLAPNAPILYDSLGNLNWQNGTWTNPLAELVNSYQSTTYTNIANAELGYEVLKNLWIKSSFGLNDIRNEESSTISSDALRPSIGRTPADSRLKISTWTIRSWIIEPQVNWSKDLSRGTLTLMAGGSFQHSEHASTLNRYNGFPSNVLIHDPSSASKVISDSRSPTEYRYAAIFGRINYNWKEKYIVNLTGRRDGSSRFGPGKKYANLGAIGLVWIFSNEAFIQNNISFLSFGKVRSSYGVTGNDQIGDYQYLDTYRASETYQRLATLYVSDLFNPDFSWETNKKLEAALDLGFFDDRIFLTAAWYRNRSSNQLINYQLAGTTGFSSILQNSPATVQNTGIEFELNTANINRGEFKWSTSFNITFPKNKLISFPNLEESSYANTYVIGKPLTITKVYHYLGLEPETGQHQFEDVNNDGLYTAEDRTGVVELVQNYFGGVNNSISWKGLQLDIFFQFVNQSGNYAYYDFSGGLYDALLGYGNVPRSALNNVWQALGDQATREPYSRSAKYEFRYGLYANSDASYKKIHFIRLKSASLSYKVPGKFLKNVKTRFYLQGQNLLTFTNFTGMDPETLTNRLPPLTTMVGGIQLTF